MWLAGIAGYAFAIWLFLRFFRFVSEVDKDAEAMQNNQANKIPSAHGDGEYRTERKQSGSPISFVVEGK